jgi:hypothetical protein
LKQRDIDNAPWISLGFFGLFFVCLTTIGRCGWGLNIAVNTSRYTSAPLLTSVATIVMAGRACERSPWMRSLFTAFAGSLLTLLLLNSMYSISKGSDLARNRELASQIVPIVPYVDERTDALRDGLLYPFFPVDGYTQGVRQGIELLGRLGFRSVYHDIKFVTNPQNLNGSFDSLVCSNGKTVIGLKDHVVARGWSILGSRKTLPPVVLFSVNGEQKFVSAALIGSGPPRAEVAKIYFENRAGLEACGWEADIPADLLPKGEVTISAWAFDPYGKEFLRLSEYQGKKAVTVQE